MSRANWWSVRGLLLVLAVGCAPTVRELGDEPEGGSGSRSIFPKGGASHGGTSQGGASQGGTAPGGATHAEPSAEGGAEPDPLLSEGGASVEPGPGPSMGGAAPTDCFSPTQHVELAQEPGATGCPCGANAEPECVGTRYLAPFLELSFACVEGAWAVVPEGACDGGAGCQTEDGIYASGAKHVPDPYSCNTCACQDGKLSCTEQLCPKPCPDNSMPALGCLECVDDECRLAHYACFTSIYVDCNDSGCFAQSACGDQLQ
jgi:hypothetical protein